MARVMTVYIRVGKLWFKKKKLNPVFLGVFRGFIGFVYSSCLYVNQFKQAFKK